MNIHKVYMCVPILPVTVGRVSSHIEAGFEPSSYQIYSSKVLITLRRHVTQLCSLDSLASEIKTTLPYGWHSFGDTCLLQQSLF